jgi:hypothetical protein
MTIPGVRKRGVIHKYQILLPTINQRKTSVMTTKNLVSRKITFKAQLS